MFLCFFPTSLALTRLLTEQMLTGKKNVKPTNFALTEYLNVFPVRNSCRKLPRPTFIQLQNRCLLRKVDV